MALSRRDLIVRSILAAPAFALAPNIVLRTSFGAPAAGAKNIVLFELDGGNDGLNTIIPFGLNGGSYYTEFRPVIGIPEGSILKINSEVGFNPGMTSLKSLYDSGRVAIVQGVSYPSPNFSHDVAAGIFATGTPSTPYGPGWVARHIASLGALAFPIGFESYSSTADGILQGSGTLIPSVYSVSDFQLPFDGKYSGDKNNRRAAYEAMAQASLSITGDSSSLANNTMDLIGLVDTFKTIPKYTSTVTYPGNGSLVKAFKLVAQMLKANLGSRYFHLSYGGFDTHSDQNQNTYHENRLRLVSDVVDAFYRDLTNQGLMDDTLIVIYTEFGRTAYENGSAGTDHGTVSPIFIIGNQVNGGLTTPHPSMNPDHLTSSKQPPMVVDFRNVWGTIVNKWLGGSASTVFPGWSLNDLGFLG